VKDKQKEFLEAYLPLQDNLWRFCLFMARNRDVAKELLAETLAIAYEGFDTLKEETALLSWLFTIARRVYNKLKVKSEKLKVEMQLEDIITSDLSPETMTDISFLYENLNKLPAEQKEAIILFNIEGFSRSEVAAMQNVSEETVKTRLARGRKRLAILMGAQDD
jgi:RNA polymerase sigma-70 factor, ECF subfamily